MLQNMAGYLSERWPVAPESPHNQTVAALFAGAVEYHVRKGELQGYYHISSGVDSRGVNSKSRCKV